MDKKLKIVITGASGFVGQHLLEDIDADKFVITIITRDTSKSFRFLPFNCNVIQADLLNVGSLKKAFQNQDVLINLAAEVRNMDKIALTNITGTKNLIEAIAHCKIKHVIHLSSVGVTGKAYSNIATTVDEITPCTPQNEYERTKHISETLLLEANSKKQFKLTVLRPTNVYGEYHTFNALLGMMRYIQKRKIVAFQKNATVNYVYVKDLTSLICTLIDSKKEYGILNVGTPKNLQAFFGIVASQLNVSIKSVLIPSLLIKFAQFFGFTKINIISNKVIYSDAKLNSFYTYPFGSIEGLKRIVEYYKKNNLLK